MNSAANILVVEDEEVIRRFVKATLEDDGHRVHEAENMTRGLIEAGTRKPDLIVLDLGLPDGDGVGFLADLRSWSSVPVIVLSARVSELDKISALDAGADDYLTKPFGSGELQARVRAQLRRRGNSAAGESEKVTLGEVVVDLGLRRVSRSGELVHLTQLEYRLLVALIAQRGKVLTHRQLLKEVWGANYVEQNHYLRIYMGHLRQKLEQDPARPHYLLTETGIGYRLSAEAENQ
ncbi:two-component system response regulator KdpE [Craterilacuibacter sinensis]|uniref:Two-component system response regulator KdpE n=1 Tax=Craterilacuibacter sinensis TaxID=2686017 RepID=A0A845BS73_9NEIS|nr:two-component system response regulator KdpE [Craterilacuibacter sinensis]MXR37371.1 two-component system response regulator KdpE [Craterilacuibacter sinensis]